MWRRWEAGESLHEIGRAFGKDHGSIAKIEFFNSHRPMHSSRPVTSGNARWRFCSNGTKLIWFCNRLFLTSPRKFLDG
jgi:hypothetical protein